jgi:hypothetical protein
LAIHVREKPPLRHFMLVTTPAGRIYRWAEDEPNPSNVFSGLRHSSTMPGGHERLDCVLTRDPRCDCPDMERLSTAVVYSAGSEPVSEVRLEDAPQVSGDQMAITPAAVGWVAALDDNESVCMVPVDRDAGSWGAPALARRVQIGNVPVDVDYRAETGGGFLQFEGPTDKEVLANSLAELLYQMPAGVRLGKFMYQGTEANTGNVEAPILFTIASLSSGSAASTGLTLNDTLQTATPGTAERYALLQAKATATHNPAAAFNRR